VLLGGGKRLPAYYIYAGTAHFDGWHQGEIDPDTAFYFTHNGGTDDQAGLDWLKNHFEPHARPGPSVATRRPRLMLCDNHASHYTYEFRKSCLDHGIHLFFFPGHATHILQPLEVVVFSPLERHVSAAVDDWTANHSLYAKNQPEDLHPPLRGCEKEGCALNRRG
jgi:hypothetical protein